jgi:hypothetical protein
MSLDSMAAPPGWQGAAVVSSADHARDALRRGIRAIFQSIVTSPVTMTVFEPKSFSIDLLPLSYQEKGK